MTRVYLKPLPAFNAWGIPKETVAQVAANDEEAEIVLPEGGNYQPKENAPTVGFLLEEDKSEKDKEYYTIGQSYLRVLTHTGCRLRFLSYESPQKQMENCHAVVLPGGWFTFPESFYISGCSPAAGQSGRRYWAYRSVVEAAYESGKPMLGICAGAQVIGVVLGGMKLHHDIRDVTPVQHKPMVKEICLHKVELEQNTPIFDILGLQPWDNVICINSRHAEAVTLWATPSPRVEMQIYGTSFDDVPEIWGNEKAGILCLQGHPEDFIGDAKMQNMYDYIAKKAAQYQQAHTPTIVSSKTQTYTQQKLRERE